jgi:hypothetical protein
LTWEEIVCRRDSRSLSRDWEICEKATGQVKERDNGELGLNDHEQKKDKDIHLW